MSAAAVALLAGCSASPGTLSTSDNQLPGDEDWVWQDHNTGSIQNSGLDALASRIDPEDIKRQAEAMQAYQGSAQQEIIDSGPELVLDPPPQASNSHQNGKRAEDGLLRAISMTGEGTIDVPIDDPDADEAELAVETEPTISRSTRIAQLSAELAGLLKQEAIQDNDPARPLVGAALIEAIATGGLDEIDLPGGGPLMLTESERQSLKTIRELGIRLAGQDSELGGDPQRIREILLESAESLREHARVRIGITELCSRAPSFGNFVPLARKTFLAGRTNRVVVYTEIEHFGLRPATTGEAMLVGDTVAADITQELELYLRSGDPKPTWQRRIEWLPRTSRHSFRDLFLASTVELPSTLAVGEYDLKIRIIDEVTGAQDESIIPIRLVADASALDGEPTRVSESNTPNQGENERAISLGGR
jgi:hypothetical protein